MKKIIMSILFLMFSVVTHAIEVIPLSAGNAVVVGQYQVQCNAKPAGEYRCSSQGWSDFGRSEWHSDKQTSEFEALERCGAKTHSCGFTTCEIR